MSSSPLTERDIVVDAAVAGALLLFTFAAFAVSDISVGPTRVLWNVLVGVFLAVALIFDWRRAAEDGRNRGRELGLTVAHWLGVFAVVNLVFLLASTGRFANADTGLACSAVVALGSYASGLRGHWVLVVVGIAVAAATAAAAILEQFIWVLFAIGVLAVVGVVLVGRLRARRQVPGG